MKCLANFVQHQHSSEWNSAPSVSTLYKTKESRPPKAEIHTSLNKTAKTGRINAILHLLRYTGTLHISTSAHQSSRMKKKNRNVSRKRYSLRLKSITLCIDCVVSGSLLIWVIMLFLSLHGSNKHNQAAPRSFLLTLLGATTVWDSTWCKNKPNVSTIAQAPLL